MYQNGFLINTIEKFCRHFLRVMNTDYTNKRYTNVCKGRVCFPDQYSVPSPHVPWLYFYDEEIKLQDSR